MPQCKAVKTFHSEQLGYLRAGTRFSADKAYANQLRARGLIVILSEGPEPARTQAFAGAPTTQGKVQSPAPPPVSRGITAESLSSRASVDLADGGAGKPSALSRAGRALQKLTAPTSKANAKP